MTDASDPHHATPLARSLLPALLALVVGAISAYAALGLVAAIQWIQSLALGIDGTDVYSQAADLPAWRVVLAPCLGGVVVGLMMHWLVPGRRNHGPAEVMAAVRDDAQPLSLRTALASAASVAVAIGCGATLGRYGPSVSLGGSIAAATSRAFALVRAQRMTLIGCGVAAAISASFSAPLAGVLFAHEVVLDAFARRGFVAITIASVTGDVVARAHGVSFSLAQLQGYRIEANHEFALFALIGVLGGLTAVIFVRGLALSARAASRVPLPGWLKPALAGALVGLVALELPQVLGLGDAAIHDAVEQQFPIGVLLMLLVAKLVLTCSCRGLGIPGGVFGPSLFLGAMLGCAVGQVFNLIDPGLVSSVQVYAVSGMGAVIACVIGAPITTILIVFEITGSYALATAVMVSVVVASLVSSRLFPYSWFAYQLKERGIDVRVGREVRIMRERRVEELVTTQYDALAARTSIHGAMEQLRDRQLQEILVIDESQLLVGQVSLIQLIAAAENGDGERDVGEIAMMPALVAQCGDSLDSVMTRLRYFVGMSVPVVEDLDRMRVVGVVYGNSIIGAYSDAVDQARREERGEG